MLHPLKGKANEMWRRSRIQDEMHDIFRVVSEFSSFSYRLPSTHRIVQRIQHVPRCVFENGFFGEYVSRGEEASLASRSVCEFRLNRQDVNLFVRRDFVYACDQWSSEWSDLNTQTILIASITSSNVVDYDEICWTLNIRVRRDFNLESNLWRFLRLWVQWVDNEQKNYN